LRTNVFDEPAYRNRRCVFRDRVHAGELLATKLKDHILGEDVQLLAIPAGGVPVGCTIAKRLNASFDVIVVRKVQIPWNTEAGFGAVSWDGSVVLNEALIPRLGLTDEAIHRTVSQAREVIRERALKFRGDRSPPNLENKVVIIVDDGLASGYTMLSAVKSVYGRSPKRTIVAVPTASTSAVDLVAPNVDAMICLNIRSGPVFAVADAYQKWHDLSDEEVLRFLRTIRDE
jgi:predicted phosphoribosyltransferase